MPTYNLNSSTSVVSEDSSFSHVSDYELMPHTIYSFDERNQLDSMIAIESSVDDHISKFK